MKTLARIALRPGMTLGEDVIWQDNVLYPAGTVLTEAIIGRFEHYSIMWATVMEDADFASTHDEKLRFSDGYKSFEEKHAANLIKYRQLMHDFATAWELIPDEVLMDIYNDLRSTYPNGTVLLDYLYKLMADEDELTYAHSLNSALLAGACAEWSAMTEEDRNNLILTGFYYDIGKLKLPNEILWRPGKLTDEEFEIVKRHSTIGWAMVGNAGLDPRIQEAILTHHERMDGSGYPNSAKGDEICLYARYIGIIDTYIAMASPRPHRGAFTPLQILGHFEKNMAKYDAEILVPLMKGISETQIGATVCLNDGSVWDVSFIHPDCYSRPILKNKDSHLLDLRTHPELEIVKMM